MEDFMQPYLTALFWVSLLLPLSVLIRRKIPFFQRFLVPASLIAGFIGMILMNFGLVGMPSPEGWAPFDFATFASLTTFIFIANFTLIGLASGRSAKQAGAGRETFRGTLWITLTFIGSYGVLYVIGIPIMLGYNWLTGASLEPATAVTMTLGFTGGPAQALAVANIWVDNTSKEGVEILRQISPDVLVMAISYGAVGFLVAAFVGVPLARYGLRKGLASYTGAESLDPQFVTGIMAKDSNESIGRHTLHPSNMDSLTFHFALLGVTLLIAWFFCYALKGLLGPGLSGLAFGLMFMWGMFIAIIVRKVIIACGIDHLIDDQQIARINGLLVDYLMVCGLMSVQWDVLSAYIVPFVITVALASIALFYWFWIPSRWLGSAGLERFLVNYAQATGTLASSLLLMRIVDPEGKSRVPAEAGFSQFLMIVPLAPLVLFVQPLIGVKYDVGDIFWIGLGILIVVSIIMIVLQRRGYWAASRLTQNAD